MDAKMEQYIAKALIAFLTLGFAGYGLTESQMAPIIEAVGVLIVSGFALYAQSPKQNK
jgi:hypothetical protein